MAVINIRVILKARNFFISCLFNYIYSNAATKLFKCCGISAIRLDEEEICALLRWYGASVV